MLYKHVPPEILKAVLATQKAHTENAKLSASDNLRAQIQNWVMKDFIFSHLNNYDHSIAEFDLARQQGTAERNRYQTELIKLQAALNAMNGSHDNPLTVSETDLVVHRLLDALATRIVEVEDFRNGLTSKLDSQPAILTNYIVNNAKIRNSLDGHFLRQDNTGNTLLTVRDLPPLYREEPTHPLIHNIDGRNQRLNILSMNSHNKLYLKEFCSMKLHESGTKSWKRIIDKLEQYNFEWRRLKDSSRIDVTFNKAANMFFYNQVLRDLAVEHGWTINAPDTPIGIGKDRGLVMQESGSLIWFTHMIKTSPDGHSHTSEVKLDEKAQYKVEPVSHKIYECARMLEGTDHMLDFNNITPERYEEFRRYSLRTLDALRTHRDLVSPELEKRLSQISVLLSNRTGPEMAETVYKMLKNAHIVNCADATAKKASPSMAALYDVKFREMVNKDPEANADKLKIYEEVGPKQISPSDTMLGQFDERHKRTCERLIREWEKSWQVKTHQRAM